MSVKEASKLESSFPADIRIKITLNILINNFRKHFLSLSDLNTNVFSLYQIFSIPKKKVKIVHGRETPEENLLTQFMLSTVNSFSSTIEISQKSSPNCSPPHSAANNGDNHWRDSNLSEWSITHDIRRARQHCNASSRDRTCGQHNWVRVHRIRAKHYTTLETLLPMFKKLSNVSYNRKMFPFALSIILYAGMFQMLLIISCNLSQMFSCTNYDCKKLNLHGFCQHVILHCTETTIIHCFNQLSLGHGEILAASKPLQVSM